MADQAKISSSKIALYIAFAQAFLALLFSLYFSEISHFLPCILCWYQRICMYPIAIILAVGILRKDQNVPYYVLPLSSIGLIIALYHNLLYFGVIPESIAPCVSGVSCTTKLIEWFGFVTIPLLSLVAFSLISVCMIISIRSTKR